MSAFITAIDYAGLLAIPLLLAIFPIYGLVRRVRVYEAFVDGAKEGFTISVRIIPYLVAILVAVKMFQASGLMDLVTGAVGPALAAVGVPAEVLPMAIVRPLTGSGSVGVLDDIASEHGASSVITWTAASIFGSTETTFYVIAVYFGAAGVRNTRHAVPAGLIADASAVLFAAWIVAAYHRAVIG